MLVKYLLVSLLVTFCVAERYDGYKVFRISTKNEDQNNLLIKLQDERVDLDFWTMPNSFGQPVDVMVAPKDQKEFVDFIMKNDMEISSFIDDVQKLIVEEHVDRSGRINITWDMYYNLESIHSWMDDLAQLYPEVTVISAGTSYEGRDIKGIKISYKQTNQSVFIEGTLHAREWISAATVTYIANDLLTSTNATVRKVAESFDWYLFPVLNPDGYVYTHTTSRLWRKTRSPQGTCVGVDLNRNFDHFWGLEGTSTNPCSDTYGGPTPFSEIENVNLNRFIKDTFRGKLDVYLSIHSYSQYLLYPYGYTTTPLENHEHLQYIADRAIEALKYQFLTQYKAGIFAEVLYKASGNSLDYFKSNDSVPIAYLYELRDTGRYGFVLPPEQILNNCKEVMFSIATIMVEGEKLGYFTLG